MLIELKNEDTQMPYSTQFEQQLRELMQDQLEMVEKELFENIQDIELFKNLLSKVVNNEAINYEEKSNVRYKDAIQNISDMINDGFSLYAGDQIVSQENNIVITTTPAPSITIKLFNTKEEKINPSNSELVKEANEEFKNIMKSTIEKYISNIELMDNNQRLDMIKNLKEKNKRVQDEQKQLKDFKGPEPGSEGHVLTEDQWLAQQQQLFNTEPVVQVNHNLMALGYDLSNLNLAEELNTDNNVQLMQEDQEIPILFYPPQDNVNDNPLFEIGLFANNFLQNPINVDIQDNENQDDENDHPETKDNQPH